MAPKLANIFLLPILAASLSARSIQSIGRNHGRYVKQFMGFVNIFDRATVNKPTMP